MIHKNNTENVDWVGQHLKGMENFNKKFSAEIQTHYFKIGFFFEFPLKSKY